MTRKLDKKSVKAFEDRLAADPDMLYGSGKSFTMNWIPTDLLNV